MRTKLTLALSAIIFTCTTPALRADQVEMQNGDRYSGKVLSMSGTNVMFESEVLGKINVPRKNVAHLALGTNTVATKTVTVAGVALPSVPTNLPATPILIKPANPSASPDLSAAFRNLGGNTNFIKEVREKMLAGSPAASSKYDEMVGSLMNGKMDMNDLRRQAATSANQLRELKRELGPEAEDTLDGYLQVLNSFLKETDAGATLDTTVP